MILKCVSPKVMTDKISFGLIKDVIVFYIHLNFQTDRINKSAKRTDKFENFLNISTNGYRVIRLRPKKMCVYCHMLKKS